MPDYTVIHKQDWFTEERYKAKPGEDASFLSRSFERHFNERPYLRHSCYLFITKTTKERMRSQSDFSTLCRSRIVPQEVGDPQAVERFAEAVSQAESILRESGLLRLRRLGAGEIIGTPGSPGLIAQYFTLSREPVTNEDIRFDPGRMMIGDKILCLHTLTDLDDLPQTVSTDARYERSLRTGATAVSVSPRPWGCCWAVITYTTNISFLTITSRLSGVSSVWPAT